MNDEPLTPTHSKSHAPAKHLLQAKASLKDLLSDKDIDFLLNSNSGLLQWAIGATQKHTNTDRFLSGLAIKPWGLEEFVEYLRRNLFEVPCLATTAPGRIAGPDPQCTRWLAAKSSEWHHQLYLLLRNELSEAEIKRVSVLTLVRLSDGSYSVGSKCYFPSDGMEHDKRFPRVDKAVYSVGKNNIDRQHVRALGEIGVREVGEPDEVRPF